MKRVLILGATGSIGLNTIDVIRQHQDKCTSHSSRIGRKKEHSALNIHKRRADESNLEIKELYYPSALVAHSKVEELAELALDVKPEAVGIYDETKVNTVQERLHGTGIEIYAGENGIAELIARGYDVTMAAIVGIAGLESTAAAIQSSKRVCIANKETLVCAGELINQLAIQHGTEIIPVDSEHSAILQIFEKHNLSNIEKITLTASGGPFKNYSLEEMVNVTPQAAITHPNWKMGPKVSLDCATLMNKGLEYIEACMLFQISPDQVDVVIHHESIIHSLVSYKEGSTLAHMGYPDMRTPIALSLSYPNRLEIKHTTLNLAELGKLHFDYPDYERFPLLKYAKQSMYEGLPKRIVLNAANEEAGSHFLNGRIKFTNIAEHVIRELDAANFAMPNSLDEVMAIDKAVRLKMNARINI